MKEQRKIPLTHIMIIGAFIFAFLQVVLLASLVHAVNVNNEIQEGLFQSGRIMVESLQHILSVQTGIMGKDTVSISRAIVTSVIFWHSSGN